MCTARILRWPVIVSLVLLSACGDDGEPPIDSGMTGDTAVADTSIGDVGESDAGDAATDTSVTTDSGGPTDSSAGDTGVADAGTCDGTWSSATTLVDDLGRLAIGARAHVVGHTAGNLVHRSSADGGETWSAPNTISAAAGNYPGMYGGLFSDGANVFLVTGTDDLASGPRQLDVRASTDHGATWGSPVRITSPGSPVFRVRVAASGSYVHVVGAGTPTPEGSVLYFRSTDGGATFESGRTLASNLGGYGGGQTVAVDGSAVHVAYTMAVMGVGGGPTLYIRSADNGATWSSPVSIGEATAESARQARVQLAAADGRVFASWQREAEFTGAPLLADRLGYNRSSDGGLTWETAQVLPGDTGVNRNHQQIWMASGGGVHFAWRHGDTASDPAGYLYSPDYGATWGSRELAIDTAGANHPFSIVADGSTVHLLTGPTGEMRYANRCL